MNLTRLWLERLVTLTRQKWLAHITVCQKQGASPALKPETVRCGWLVDCIILFCLGNPQVKFVTLSCLIMGNYSSWWLVWSRYWWNDSRLHIHCCTAVPCRICMVTTSVAKLAFCTNLGCFLLLRFLILCFINIQSLENNFSLGRLTKQTLKNSQDLSPSMVTGQSCFWALKEKAAVWYKVQLEKSQWSLRNIEKDLLNLLLLECCIGWS